MTQIGGDAPVSATTAEGVNDTEADAVAAMSDDEAKALLAQELEFLSISGAPEEPGS